MYKEKDQGSTPQVDFGVVTFFASNNFGAVLQAYALQQKIIGLGYSAEILNYDENNKNPLQAKKKVWKTYVDLLKMAGLDVKLLLRARKASSSIASKFDVFRKNNMNISRERLYDMEDLAEIEGRYKGIIAGSDMVWTEKGQNLEAFFLRFTEKNKRLSYAASLTGTDALSVEQRAKMGKYISEVEFVSCREDEGVDFAREFGKEAFLALDPTLLLTKDEWSEKFSLKESREDYILCYCFDKTPKNFFKKVNKLAKKMNTGVRYIALSLDKRIEEMKNGHSAVYGPKEFIELFFNAKFVITNSFHGLLFSIIGKKPFALLRREESCKWKKNEERMLNMLRVIGEESRAVYSIDEVDESFFDLDYSHAQAVLSRKREESIEYLENMLKSACQNKTVYKRTEAVCKIEDVSKKLCTGCSACANICPQNAIEMKPDAEGFLRPVVDGEKCINCDLCVKKCPAVNDVVQQTLPMVGYVAFSEDAATKKSASGGVFFALAKHVINQMNGVVYGCVMEEKSLKCVHKRAEKMEDLYPMQNSKYVQSDVSRCFELVKEDLKKNKVVLFSGTPCQIAGLRSYLGQEYENLITADIICHGVPSPWLWEQKVASLQKKFGNTVKSYTFRNKDNEDILRSAYEGTVVCDRGKVKYKSWEDGYFKTFLEGKTYRMSCYYCKYANIYRCGDLTLGDCDSWRDYLDFYPQKAKSSVLINTEKGNDFWDKTKELFVFAELDVERERKINKQLSGPTPMPACRKTIYQEASSMDWESLERKYSRKRSRVKSAFAKIAHKVIDRRKNS